MASDSESARNDFRPSIVIPYYNHPRTIANVIASLAPLQLHCYLVDDASSPDSREVLEGISLAQGHWVTVLRHAQNQGKGGAVMTGCERALRDGYTHALQIDADGQHEIGDVPALLSLSRTQPATLVTGVPIYDASVPRGRYYGRYVTHVWVWINTLSFAIKDSMCGLRVYPLQAVSDIWRRSRVGKRMDFDVEIMVRAAWRGISIAEVPTRVRYPADGVSHFDIWRDNLAISGMHARLFVGMLWRSPLLIGRRVMRFLRAQRPAVPA